MIIPVRCFTCGNVIADKYLLYLDLVSQGVSEEDAMNAFHLERFCCRRMMLTHVDMTDLLLKFNPADTNVLGTASVAAAAGEDDGAVGMP
ncbi:putative DNA-directed RNA polymerase ii 8.2 Kdpolypeptide [Leishmania major strain Friedlin]|uniref:DNA-directed RNA polymerases I, II, and III subunit RPABC5 n=1 Tax=Leishmania major TaxID=5664 RepID=Q4QG42_LEIMA|nr:putative DNA-directed RNA polymerase ii 8.2 Kdpolypeptide [Leishmania major strain Friedlin]CAG9571079.1 DNA-directed_RNA_polymerase_I_subunit_-_putative [Leishmania major strain Friedlin]CAJ02972.1 putative DNA-directed RNA polymerase ii 8.2 Kdpolypeptide [Leishmania major strain Friedlin]|eukprot:XP_001681856.1 putative DNA-directed RNA polymerase ii 8.2 Kdpolypeptide [Leishmania major strain Friedlin]